MESVAEQVLRERLFAAVGALADRNGGFVTRAELSAVSVAGETFRLIDQSRGIWNPGWASSTLSILSDPEGPYHDEITPEGLLRYAYQRGTAAGINRKLRNAVVTGSPLLLLLTIDTGVYAPHFPVYVVNDNPDGRYVEIAVEEEARFLHSQVPADDRRRYAQRMAQVRLHQAEFRGRVIRAYEGRCSVCTLNHPELLDAAHILPDTHTLGLPVVTNGLALCKIHHTAYDRNLLGIDAQARVHITPRLLAETNGPMLRYGLQEMNGRRLLLPATPKERPDEQRLDIRFADFLAAR